MTSGLSQATIRLRTLGSVDLCAADGAQMHSVLRQPKRFALLVYLALNGPAFQRRDRLVATFWPESNEERARANLAQQVFHLRTALGKDAIVGRGDDEIGLAGERVWCDAVAFDDLLRAGRPADAMELYTGELLPGFILDDMPEFERWLDEERARLRGEAAGACGKLARTAEQAGDVQLAVHWSRQAVAIEPYSEAGYQRLIGLLDKAGDRAAALRAYDELRDLLRNEFEAEPSAETTELIQAVRTRMAPSGLAARLLGMPAGEAHEAVIPPRRSLRTALLAATTLIIIIIAAVAWGVVRSRRGAPYTPPANHVAVLYFSDQSPAQDLAYLAEGLTSTLIDQLGQVKQLQVVSQNGVRPFRGESTPLDSIARQLDAGTIVGGSITSSNDRLRVTVQLIDGASGMVRESKRLERPNGELFALLDDVTAEVATFLRSTLGSEIRLQQWQRETGSEAAWQLSSRAEVLQASGDSAQRSGDIASATRDFELADSLLASASRIDRNWVTPAIMRGRLAEKRAWMSRVTDTPPRSAEWLRTGRGLANQALKIDGRSHSAYELRGTLSFTESLIAAPRGTNVDSLLREAERDLNRALVINPDLPRAASRLSAVYYIQGRFEEARQAALRALQADAYLTDADDIVNRLFYTSFETGNDEEAGYWCDEIRRRMPNRWTSAYCDLILLGWSNDARPDPRKALHLLERAGTNDSPAVQKAMRPHLTILAAGVLARAGERDSARAMIRRAREAAPQDRELLYLEAAVRVIMGEMEAASRLLREYYTDGPNAQPRAENRRMFRLLRAARDSAQQQ